MIIAVRDIDAPNELQELCMQHRPTIEDEIRFWWERSRDDIVHPDVPPADQFLEFRLRFFEDTLYLYFGDPGYDTDHRGSWSAYSYNGNEHSLSGVVMDAINELVDDYVMDQSLKSESV